jgi:hypothetical protein
MSMEDFLHLKLFCEHPNKIRRLGQTRQQMPPRTREHVNQALQTRSRLPSQVRSLLSCLHDLHRVFKVCSHYFNHVCELFAHQFHHNSKCDRIIFTKLVHYLGVGATFVPWFRLTFAKFMPCVHITFITIVSCFHITSNTFLQSVRADLPDVRGPRWVHPAVVRARVLRHPRCEALVGSVPHVPMAWHIGSLCIYITRRTCM